MDVLVFQPPMFSLYPLLTGYFPEICTVAVESAAYLPVSSLQTNHLVQKNTNQGKER